MGELDDFLAQVTPALQSADFAIHNGDPKPRIELWSHNDPVTIFGAVRNTTGWSETRQGFEWLASRFTRCDSFDFDVVAAGVSGDLGYLVAHEHTVAAIGDAEPERYDLRVTWVFRREAGDWKVVHRHADPFPNDAGTARTLSRM